MGSGDDPAKPMINLSSYLMKKRKWPYRGWHKRFFLLQNGYLTYGKSEQEVIHSLVDDDDDINSLPFAS